MQVLFRALLVMFIVAFQFSLTAQDQSKKEDFITYPKFNIRTSLTSWFDFNAGMTLGIGYRWNEFFSAAFEPTWLFYKPNYYSNERVQHSGIKIRTDFKYYPPETKHHNDEFFIALELHYKYISKRHTSSFGNNNPITNYHSRTTEKGVIGKVGFLTTLPFVRNRQWILEFYGGLGIKFQEIVFKNLPPGVSIIPHQLITPMDDPVMIMIPAGIKLAYQL